MERKGEEATPKKTIFSVISTRQPTDFRPPNTKSIRNYLFIQLTPIISSTSKDNMKISGMPERRGLKPCGRRRDSRKELMAKREIVSRKSILEGFWIDMNL